MLGSRSSSQAFLSSLQPDTEDPLYDYCHAADAFVSGARIEALDWISLAGKKYSVQINESFADSLVEMGYLTPPKSGDMILDGKRMEFTNAPSSK